MPTCFFTYSWEKNEKKENQLNNLLSQIKQKIETFSNYDVTVLYDRESFKKGDNFIKREQQIQESDCVLIFFSPAYKKKITEEYDSGVYREYKMLRDRALSDEGGVIPILLSGTRETAVPDEFKNIIYWDLSDYKGQVYKSDGRVTLSDTLDEYVDDLAKKAIRKACAVAFCKNPEFSSIEEKYQALFLDSSATTPLPSECIIKTIAHEGIINQRIYFIIGRKGSGKSTLLTTIQRYDPFYYQEHYKKLASIDAETLDISFIYNNLIGKVRNDLDVIGMQKILDTFWEVLFILQSMLTIGIELECFEITKDDHRYSVFKNVTEKLKSLLGISCARFKDGLMQDAVCHCAVELVEQHIHFKLLDRADNRAPLTGAISSLDSFIIMADIFGRDLFQEYCQGIKQCKKKVLFALDGFDTHSEDFRKTTNLLAKINEKEYQFRTDFEICLFRELMVVVSNIKRKKVHLEKQHFFSAVHFCIILPQDRYDQIALDDRDIDKRNICSLNWDAYDLMEMLVKRLEYHFHIPPALKKGSLKDRFDEIISKYLPNIPTQINITHQGYRQRISLFNF